MCEPNELRAYLEKCRDAVTVLPSYALADEVLRPIFRERPENTSPSDVLLKVVTLNSLYATSVYAVYRMADHVAANGEQLDAWLQAGDDRAVDKIRHVPRLLTRNKIPRDFYSFATKYCHWHRPSLFPMYDRYVRDALQPLRRSLDLPIVEAERLRKTKTFRNVIDGTRAALNWTDSGYKSLDQALWILGQRLDPDVDPDLRKFVGRLPRCLRST